LVITFFNLSRMIFKHVILKIEKKKYEKFRPLYLLKIESISYLFRWIQTSQIIIFQFNKL